MHKVIIYSSYVFSNNLLKKDQLQVAAASAIFDLKYCEWVFHIQTGHVWRKQTLTQAKYSDTIGKHLSGLKRYWVCGNYGHAINKPVALKR